MKRWRSNHAMKVKRTVAFALLVALVLVVVSGILVQARSDDWTVPWWTVDGGGGISSGAGFSLKGTVGQSDAGPMLQGGGYALKGGYWAAGGSSLYLPLVRRDAGS